MVNRQCSIGESGKLILTAAWLFCTFDDVIVALDIDGVVADFLSPFLRYLEGRLGKGPISADSITDFRFQDHPILSEEAVGSCMEEVSSDSDFWRDLSSLIGPRDWARLDAMSRQRRLMFITHRSDPPGHDMRATTEKWLQRQGISRPVVHLTQEPKSHLIRELRAGVFVDDRHENCEDVAEKSAALVFMPHRHYNQRFTHPRVTRIREFGELFSYIPK